MVKIAKISRPRTLPVLRQLKVFLEGKSHNFLTCPLFCKNTVAIQWYTGSNMSTSDTIHAMI